MRASKNQWAISPERIMAHHFRLAKGVPSVVDASPPYSMYHSPISIHYVPKRRSSSAEPSKRISLSKPQRELNDFVNGRNGSTTNLRLPLPIRSSLTNLAKPKLLENRNYQPPTRRKALPKKEEEKNDIRNTERQLKITKFKDGVLTDIIDANVFTDKFISNIIRIHMEKLAGVIPWDDMEAAGMELMEQLEVNDSKKSRSKALRLKPPKVEKIGTPKSLEALTSSSSSSYSSSSSKLTSSTSGSSSSSSGSV